MACEIKEILLDSAGRGEHVSRLLKLDGIGDVREDKGSIYCAVPLTGAKESEKAMIGSEHDKIKACVKAAGLKIFDPKDSPYNPWGVLTGKPVEVYDIDTLQVVTPRFFEFTNVFPSTGAGIEVQKALTYGKIPVIVNKSGIYTSRMANGARRAIVIEYEDAERQKDEIAGVFKILLGYEPGIGICSRHGNTLLGFKHAEAPVCLPGLIESSFPNLVYDFDKYLAKK